MEGNCRLHVRLMKGRFNGKQLTHLYRSVCRDFINFHQTINLFDLSMELNENMPLFHHKKIVRITHTAGVLRDKIKGFYGKIIYFWFQFSSQDIIFVIFCVALKVETRKFNFFAVDKMRNFWLFRIFSINSNYKPVFLDPFV